MDASPCPYVLKHFCSSVLMFLCPFVLRVSGPLRRQPLCFFGHADVSPWPAAQRPFVYLMYTYVAYVFRAKRLTQTLYLLFLCPFVLMFSALAATQTKKHYIPLTSSLSAPSAPLVMLAPHAVQCSLAAAPAGHLQLHQFTP